MIACNANSGGKETNSTAGGFDVTVDGSIKIVWGVDRGFLFRFWPRFCVVVPT